MQRKYFKSITKIIKKFEKMQARKKGDLYSHLYYCAKRLVLPTKIINQTMKMQSILKILV